jgi:Kef-type K+ transport system membrane component KefB
MSMQQVNGLALSLVGVAALILSVGIAWSLSRVTRTRQVEGAGVIMVVSVALFLAGVVACFFGVSALVEG